MQRKILISTFLLFTIVASVYPQTNQIIDFESLMKNLQTGIQIKSVIKYASCELYDDSGKVESPNAIGGMEIRTFEYFAQGAVKNKKAFVTSSESVLINHPRYKIVINYVKLRIYEDNSVEIIAQYFDPKTYEIKMNETFKCFINDGKNGGGVYFYKL